MITFVEMGKWLSKSIEDFSDHGNTAIADHFKGVDGKVRSKFPSGTKGYVDYLSSVGAQFTNKLNNNGKAESKQLELLAKVILL